MNQYTYNEQESLIDIDTRSYVVFFDKNAFIDYLHDYNYLYKDLICYDHTCYVNEYNAIFIRDLKETDFSIVITFDLREIEELLQKWRNVTSTNICVIGSYRLKEHKLNYITVCLEDLENIIEAIQKMSKGEKDINK